MKLSIVARHLPEREGTATGRALRALVDGLFAEGHEVDVWSWSPDPPAGELPGWCTWRPLPAEPWMRMKARALMRPRDDAAIAGWRPAEGAIPMADDPVCFPAVAPFRHNVLVQHYLAKIDLRVLGERGLPTVQSFRAERRYVRQADVALAFSERVASGMRRLVTVVPIAYEPPDRVLEPVDRPVAVMLANWRWPPNLAALRTLVDVWPDVSDRVAGARLLIAGRGIVPDAVGSLRGVEVVGEVARVEDVLCRAAVVAFPCPPTSGPKVKVIEA
ncbi:MAG: hypothetical protein QOJ09_2800, partial [Actinomycetota bacterium]|nr:hypothetical protein [Actinomycetota bacterium]